MAPVSRHSPRTGHHCCRSEGERRRESGEVASSPSVHHERGDVRPQHNPQRDRRREVETRLHEEVEKEKTKKSARSIFWRWAKAFVGIMIALGLVFVFYVITVIIIDNSSPLDLLTFGGAPDTATNSRNLNVTTQPKGNTKQDIARNFGKMMNKNLENNSSIKNNITKQVLSSSSTESDKPSQANGVLPESLDEDNVSGVNGKDSESIPIPVSGGPYVYDGRYAGGVNGGNSNLVPIIPVPSDNFVYDGRLNENHQRISAFDLKPSEDHAVLDFDPFDRKDKILDLIPIDGFQSYYNPSLSQEDTKHDHSSPNYQNPRRYLRISSKRNSEPVYLPSSLQKNKYLRRTFDDQLRMPLARPNIYRELDSKVRLSDYSFLDKIGNSNIRPYTPNGYLQIPLERSIDPLTPNYRKVIDSMGNVVGRLPLDIRLRSDKQEISYQQGHRRSDSNSAFYGNPGLQRSDRSPISRLSRERLRSISSYRPPEDFRYPDSAKSIQDIIRYMNEDENLRGHSRSNFRNLGSNSKPNRLKDTREIRIPSGFSIGDQNHVVGYNFHSNDNEKIDDNSRNPLLDEYLLDKLELDSYRESENDDTSIPIRHDYEDSSFRRPKLNNFDIVDHERGRFDEQNDETSGDNAYKSTKKYRIPIQREIHNIVGTTTLLPPVENTYNTRLDFDRSQSYGKSLDSRRSPLPGDTIFEDRSPRPPHGKRIDLSQSLQPRDPRFEFGRKQSRKITLDIYPSTDTSLSSYKTLLDGNSFVDEYEDRLSDRRKFRQRNEDYFNPEENENTKIVLHINLFSKPLRDQQTQSPYELKDNSVYTISVQIPLEGDISSLDVYREIVGKADRNAVVRAQKLEAAGNSTKGSEEEVKKIELFKVERGPALYEAVEDGLMKLNSFLPEDDHIIFPNEVSDEDLLVDKENTKII